MISDFRSPWWLPGAHLQTIVPALFARRAPVLYARERWDTPDGDIVDVDRVGGVHGKSVPTLVVFHGLEGSAQSRYVRGLLAAGAALGWHGIAPHFRGCGSTPSIAPRFYHSGDSAEVDWIFRRAASERPEAPLFAVGISLGGNMLLKWLGEQGSDARTVVVAAASISAPMDLSAGGASLGRGFNRIYAKMFLRTLKAKGRAKLAHHAGLFDRNRMEAARDLHAFDDVVTAPVHGFRDADDYWLRASSKPLLKRIEVPTLILNARNDPFLPASALPGRDDVAPAVTLEFPAHGGHVGFLAPGRGGSDWMPRRVIRFLASNDDHRRAEARAAA
ncbi:MAG: alpha/beta fold hydrolase [Burkholderiaceae bacterium]